MKEPYIKQVEKELHLSRKATAEVVRDLNEIFASAAEHGETEQQVIERLGTPKEFADSTAEQFGIDNAASQKRKGIIYRHHHSGPNFCRQRGSGRRYHHRGCDMQEGFQRLCQLLSRHFERGGLPQRL